MIKKIKNLTFFLFLLHLSSSNFAFGQQPPMGDPAAVMQQMFPGIKMGQLVGQIFTYKDGVKTPVPKLEVALIAFQGEKELLKLHKPVSEKGEFTFKNIFRDPQFYYIIGTVYEGKMYVYDRISLAASQEEYEVELQVGPGSPYEMVMPDSVPENSQTPTASDQSMPFVATNQTAPLSVKGFASQPHQKVSLLLVGIVFVFCGYFYWGWGKSGVSQVPLGNYGQKESDLMVLSWLREEYKKGQLPEDVFKVQEEKLLSKIKGYYTSANS